MSDKAKNESVEAAFIAGATDDQRSPEVRVVGTSNEGEIFLSFTNEMMFPPDFLTTLNLRYVKSDLTEVDPISATRLLSDEEEPKSQSMLTVQMLLT